MSAITIIEEAFGAEANLYTTVLGLSTDCSESISSSQLRKAYYRRALLYHPDKQTKKSVDDVQIAKRRFQAVSVAYSILSDEERRKVYDTCGEMEEDDSSNTHADAWRDYFKNIFGKVTTEDIDKFTESYKCSEEEEKDVLKYYVQFKGDLNKMLECVMCSSEIDKRRWMEDYIKPAIYKNEVEDFQKKIEQTLGGGESDNVNSDDESNGSKYGGHSDKDDDASETEDEESDAGATSSKKQTKQMAVKKKAPPKKRKNKKDPPISDDLIAAIRGRSSESTGFGSVLSGLEQRYAPKVKGGRTKRGRKPPAYDITDDEFEKIQKKLKARKNRK
mmetsp:Transcript_20443/g.31020  ORF Transcript_20443/g.31020 Transcript_20443/m.31020 type:complete len:332 (-) Transcript_20443:70-1065(-)